jgi:hypothetical protein
VSNVPKLWHEPLSDTVKIVSKHALTFTNAGNRSAAILGVNLLLERNFPGGPMEVSCPGGGRGEGSGTASSAAYDLKAVVLKPREISIKDVHLTTPNASPDPDDGVNLSLLNMATPPDYTVNLYLCMRFYVATPDASYSIIEPLGNMSFKNNQPLRYNVARQGSTNQSLFDQLKIGEWTLVNRKQFVFDSGRSADAAQN